MPSYYHPPIAIKPSAPRKASRSLVSSALSLITATVVFGAGNSVVRCYAKGTKMNAIRREARKLYRDVHEVRVSEPGKPEVVLL